MDFVWPLHNWIEGHGGWERVKCVHARDEHSRHFTDHFHAIVGKELRGMDHWARVLDFARTSSMVQIHGLNSRLRDYCRTFTTIEDLRRSRTSFVDRITRNCSSASEFASDDYLVALIERAPAPDGRVASQRSIQGHQALSAAIAQHCRRLGVAFLNLSLEKMSFREQFQVLRKGPTLLIGQHGAGLLNGLWMEHENCGVIELASRDNPFHFEHLYTDLRMPYERIICPAQGEYGRRQVLQVEALPVLLVLERMLERRGSQ